MGREAARDVGRTRVPGDMIGQQIRLEAKGTEPFGDPIGRVITDQHRAAAPVRIDRLDRGRSMVSNVRSGPRCCLSTF